MPIAIINALLQLLSVAPTLTQDIANLLNEHWGQDHVQQALTGLSHLNKIVADVAPTAASIEATLKDAPTDVAPTPATPQTDIAAATPAA